MVVEVKSHEFSKRNREFIREMQVKCLNLPACESCTEYPLQMLSSTPADCASSVCMQSCHCLLCVLKPQTTKLSQKKQIWPVNVACQQTSSAEAVLIFMKGHEALTSGRQVQGSSIYQYPRPACSSSLAQLKDPILYLCYIYRALIADVRQS